MQPCEAALIGHIRPDARPRAGSARRHDACPGSCPPAPAAPKACCEVMNLHTSRSRASRTTLPTYRPRSSVSPCGRYARAARPPSMARPTGIRDEQPDRRDRSRAGRWPSSGDITCGAHLCPPRAPHSRAACSDSIPGAPVRRRRHACVKRAGFKLHACVDVDARVALAAFCRIADARGQKQSERACIAARRTRD